ncbi:MAG: hypothetical protein JXB62_16095 [Pirellulales bacterium]|nr:hypothetical protein [Pirellulales bacterium]
MGYGDVIECPECECRVLSGSEICPYCSAPIPAPEPWGRSYAGVWVLAVFVVIAILCCDAYLGTHVIETLDQFFSD